MFRLPLGAGALVAPRLALGPREELRPDFWRSEAHEQPGKYP